MSAAEPLTPEELAKIRAQIERGSWRGPRVRLLATIDALEAEVVRLRAANTDAWNRGYEAGHAECQEAGS